MAIKAPCCLAPNCFAPDPTKKCSRCKIIPYCCRECQVADWAEHKRVCRISPAELPRLGSDRIPSFSTYFYLINLSISMGCEYLVPVLSMVDVLAKNNQPQLVERFSEQFLDLKESSEHMDKLKVSYGSSLLEQNKEFEKAETYLLRGLELQDKEYGESSEVSMRALLNLGTLYAKTGEAQKSITHYIRGLPKQETTEGAESTSVFFTVYQIAVQYLILSEYEKSLKYFERALALNQKWRPHRVPGIDKKVCCDILENISAIYAALGEETKATQFTERAALMK